MARPQGYRGPLLAVVVGVVTIVLLVTRGNRNGDIALGQVNVVSLGGGKVGLQRVGGSSPSKRGGGLTDYRPYQQAYQYAEQAGPAYQSAAQGQPSSSGPDQVSGVTSAKSVEVWQPPQPGGHGTRSIRGGQMKERETWYQMMKQRQEEQQGHVHVPPPAHGVQQAPLKSAAPKSGSSLAGLANSIMREEAGQLESDVKVLRKPSPDRGPHFDQRRAWAAKERGRDAVKKAQQALHREVCEDASHCTRLKDTPPIVQVLTKRLKADERAIHVLSGDVNQLASHRLHALTLARNEAKLREKRHFVETQFEGLEKTVGRLQRRDARLVLKEEKMAVGDEKEVQAEATEKAKNLQLLRLHAKDKMEEAKELGIIADLREKEAERVRRRKKQLALHKVLKRVEHVFPGVMHDKITVQVPASWAYKNGDKHSSVTISGHVRAR